MKGLSSLFILVALTVAAMFGWRWWSQRNKAEPLRYESLIEQSAARHNMDPSLVKAVIRQESNFDANARGKAGEYGLMQITEGAAKDWERGTGKSYGSPGSLFRPKLNIEIGTWYLAQGYRKWEAHDDVLALSLAQYNAGPSRAQEWAEAAGGKKIPDSIPFRSTREYINDVMQHYRSFSRERRRHDEKEKP
ncbi:MAG: lytic transglycosylase domain-containing protein [Lentisphaeria bacterium]|jgi:soluble lytic murein transglycosylase|nr:lytic transglycosylase domain-containing protein [Lentisphaeria bacterium]